MLLVINHNLMASTAAPRVNDAISLFQTADGALSVIDEKLIRVKELAEQVPTGAYNSDQRIIIDSEFQASESRISDVDVSNEMTEFVRNQIPTLSAVAMLLLGG